MLFLIQLIDSNGTVINDDVAGFAMRQEGADALLRYLAKQHPSREGLYIMVPNG